MTRQADVLFAKGTPETLLKKKLFTQVMKKNQCKQLKKRPTGRSYGKRFSLAQAIFYN